MWSKRRLCQCVYLLFVAKSSFMMRKSCILWLLQSLMHSCTFKSLLLNSGIKWSCFKDVSSCIILISRASPLDFIARSLKVPKMSPSSNEAWQIHGNISWEQIHRTAQCLSHSHFFCRFEEITSPQRSSCHTNFLSLRRSSQSFLGLCWRPG